MHAPSFPDTQWCHRAITNKTQQLYIFSTISTESLLFMKWLHTQNTRYACTFFFIYSDNPQNKKGLRKLKTTEVDILQEVTNTNQSHYTRRNGQKNRVGKQWSYKKMRKNLAAVGFEPTPPGRLVPKTSALDHSATLPLTPAAAWYATIPFMIATVLLL